MTDHSLDLADDIDPGPDAEPRLASWGGRTYTEMAVDDFLSLANETSPRLSLTEAIPNYAEWPLSLPAGHWRAIHTLLTNIRQRRVPTRAVVDLLVRDALTGTSQPLIQIARLTDTVMVLLQQAPRAPDTLSRALRLARDMMQANGLDLPRTREVIDDALQAADDWRLIAEAPEDGPTPERPWLVYGPPGPSIARTRYGQSGVGSSTHWKYLSADPLPQS